MSDVIIKMQNISKSFSGIKALNNVHIELKKGEVHALMGENGAGKSTLMKIMTGVYTKDSGEMLILDETTQEMRPVEFKEPLQAQKMGLSMVFQELNLLENMNIAENIFIGREPVGKGSILDRHTLNQMAAVELKKVKLNISPETPIADLSCGQKQCVEIAKALSFHARVVVFDEPTASLSERESEVLFEIIRELKAQGVCIVYISHRMEEVFALSDRITVFRNGEYIDTVETDAVSEMDLIKMMIGHDLDVSTQHDATRVNKSKTVLSVRNIQALKGAKPISFDLHEREILGVFGLVGAGRTEMSRVIFGIDPIGAGEIYVQNQRVHINCPRDAINAGLGLVPEDRKGLGLILGMSVQDNMLISKIGKLKSVYLRNQVLKRMIKPYIDNLDIVLRDENQSVKELSGGNQQKVVIAKWLAMTPDILILDEPTRGIDVGAKNEIYQLMQKLAEAGKSIIMISSEMAEILRVSDRVMVMHEGEITADIPIEQADNNTIMQAAFGGIDQ